MIDAQRKTMIGILTLRCHKYHKSSTVSLTIVDRCQYPCNLPPNAIIFYHFRQRNEIHPGSISTLYKSLTARNPDMTSILILSYNPFLLHLPP